MSRGLPIRGVYVNGGTDATFGVFHPAAEADRSDVAVLLCPPFGWEEFCSFRSRRSWACDLAAGGHPALRIDLPGSGDSGGSPRDPGRLTAWTEAAADAAGWLREETGCGRVAAIGIGLGGLVAVGAVSSGAAIDDLVLWATPARGRTSVRELRAFARLNATEVDPADAITAEPLPESPPLPDGSLEVGGFLLSAETLDQLGALDLTALPLPDPAAHRVLLLEREGIAPDARLREFFEGAGAAVTVAPGPGYSAMMDHPQQARAPVAELAAVKTWLADARPSDVAGVAKPGPGERRLELTVDGVGIRETPLVVDQPFGQLVGVLAEPVEEPTAQLCAVLLNAGALRRIGPGRMWVDVARRWAARGVPTLRIDLEGIGDADGDSTPYADTGALYSLGLVDQVLATLDELEARGLPSRFALMGLCSGAYWSFHAALRDQRVRAALLLNPRALFWDESIDRTRDARRIAKLFSRSSWGRLLRGQIPPSEIRAILRPILGRLLRPGSGSRARDDRDSAIERAFDQLDASGQRVLLTFGGGEPLYEELEREHRLEQIDRLSNLELKRIPGRDHTLRPIRTQQLVTAILDRALDRELESGR